METGMKKYALILAFVLSGLIISEALIFTSFSVNETGRESVVIQRVIDGDTIKLEDGRTVRLLNINSPEKGMPNWNLSAEFLKKFENRTISLEITGIDKYKRSLARIYSPDYLNLEIVKLGLASKFLVQESELSDFANAEDYAIKNSLGIWIRSNSFGCFSASVNEVEEVVEMKSICPEISLKGWMVKDESRKTYYFGNISFSKINLHSGQGTDNSTDIFWNNPGDIWNNDRDSLYLFEPDGRIAFYESYGY